MTDVVDSTAHAGGGTGFGVTAVNIGDDAVEIHISGDVDAAAVERLRQVCRCGSGVRVLVDLNRVTSISSDGADWLLDLRAASNQFIIRRPSPDVARLLRALGVPTGLDVPHRS